MGKRRPSGDGMVRKRDDGRWEGRIVIGHKENGLPIYKSVLSKSQKELTAKLNQLKEVYKGADLTEDCNMTLSEWLDRWMDIMIGLSACESTILNYRKYIKNHIVPYLGDKKISLITTSDIQKMYTKLKNEGRVHPKPDGSKELAGSTVRSVHAVLHEAMEMAVSQRIIIRNPTVGTVLPKVVPKPINPFNTEQLDKFLSVIQNEPEWHDLFYMEVTTGLRRGEVCGLKWSDFDADSGSIKVSRTVTPAPHGLFKIGDTKTENGMRTIILVPSTLEMLKERQKSAVSQWIFPNFFLPDLPINPHSAYTKFKSILKKYGLPDIRFHDLRHTFATQAVFTGINPKVLSDILGHADASFTLDRYAHVTADMQEKASEIVGGIMTDILKETNY